MSIILKNATFINWETLDFSTGNFRITQGPDGIIEPLKPNIPLIPNPDERIIDCSGKLVTRSFVVGHHHAYSALARGMPATVRSPANFREILQYIWWNLDKNLDKEMIEACGYATAMACAKAGATFIIDHHASPNCIANSLQVLERAFEKVGISHLLCYEITDRDGREKAMQGLAETERHLQQSQGLVGLHASFTISDHTLKGAVALAQKYNSGLHVHLAEDLYDQQHSKEYYHKSVVQRFYDAGLLSFPKTILVHALHIDQSDRTLIKNNKVWVAENMESNLNNKVGLFNAEGLEHSRILLGTDGMHSDLLQSAKAAFFAGQLSDKLGYAAIYQRFRNAHRYLNENEFSGDGQNNLVILNYDSPTPINSNNFLGHFLYGIRAEHIQHVISQGRCIVYDRTLQQVDEDELLSFTRQQARRLWDRL